MRKGDIVHGKILKIYKTNVVISVNDYKGILYISNISDYYVSRINNFFKIDKMYQFKILSINKYKKTMILNWKAIHPRYLKDPFSFDINETKNGFKNLKDSVKKNLKD